MDIDLEQQGQLLAREYMQRERQVSRETIDTIPRTLLTSGVVFLSLVVPLYFRQKGLNENVRVCFLVSAALMFISMISCGLLLARANRISMQTIKHMERIVNRRALWSECNIPNFRWWEIVEFVIACLAFSGAITTLIVAMFLR